MPAKPPPVAPGVAAQIHALGQGLRAERVRQKLTATAVAEAAGMSRVTLHRIERGEASVTMGAYLSVFAALGLTVVAVPPSAGRAAEPLIDTVVVADYPELQKLAWQLPGVTELSPAEALALYERNWRHLDPGQLKPAELALVRRLSQALGGGRLLV